MAYHRTLPHLDPVIDVLILSSLKHFLLFAHVYLSFHTVALGPLHPVLRTNIDRPCPLDTKMGTLIWGSSSLWAQIVARACTLRKPHRLGTLGTNLWLLSLGLEWKVDSESTSV